MHWKTTKVAQHGTIMRLVDALLPSRSTISREDRYHEKKIQVRRPRWIFAVKRNNSSGTKFGCNDETSHDSFVNDHDVFPMIDRVPTAMEYHSEGSEGSWLEERSQASRYSSVLSVTRTRESIFNSEEEEDADEMSEYYADRYTVLRDDDDFMINKNDNDDYDNNDNDENSSSSSTSNKEESQHAEVFDSSNIDDKQMGHRKHELIKATIEATMSVQEEHNEKKGNDDADDADEDFHNFAYCFSIPRGVGISPNHFCL
jgi:hypothetical protein